MPQGGNGGDDSGGGSGGPGAGAGGGGSGGPGGGSGSGGGGSGGGGSGGGGSGGGDGSGGDPGGGGSGGGDGSGGGSGGGGSGGGGGGNGPPPRCSPLNVSLGNIGCTVGPDPVPPAPPVPGAPPPPPTPAAPGAPAAPVLPPAAVVAQMARENMPIRIPQPHTSPPEGGFQLTGLRTWFWMDQGQWTPVVARAELPGIWAEVTATPTRSVWTPADGSDPVTCAGPGRKYPGGEGQHQTDCGHVYTEIGDYTIRVAVTYTVTWRSSTGETGSQPAIVLTTDLPIRVEQRQAVIDP